MKLDETTEAKLDVQPRPKLNLPICKSEIALEVLAVPPILLTFTVVLLYWPIIPAVVPSHFDLEGHPNGWSGRGLLWVLPFVSLATSIFMSIMCKYPHTFNYIYPITEKNAEKQYMLARKFFRLMKFEQTMLIFLVVWNIIQVSTKGRELSDSATIIAMAAIMFGSVLTYIFAARRYK